MEVYKTLQGMTRPQPSTYMDAMDIRAFLLALILLKHSAVTGKHICSMYSFIATTLQGHVFFPVNFVS